MKRCRGCLTVNDNRKRNCGACGKKLAPKRRPKHLKALELTYQQYVELNGGEHCGICQQPPKEGRKLHRDHDHRTGQPRGLLCFRDNSALRVYMTAEWVRRALAYLERSEAA